MLDPDSDSLRDRIAVWLRGNYEDAVEDATGSTPAEGSWLADADGVLGVLHRYARQSQRTRPRHDRCLHGRYRIDPCIGCGRRYEGEKLIGPFVTYEPGELAQPGTYGGEVFDRG